MATRHPVNDQRRAIEVRRLDGDRVDGVNQIEVLALRGLVGVDET